MDTFHALTGGARFKKSKNDQVMDLFQSDDGKKKEVMLDLFGTSVAAPQQKASRKRTTTEVEEEEEEEKESPSFDTQEEINAFRNRLHIKVRGEDVPAPITTFDAMPFPDPIRSVILRNIEESAWKEPTPIQMQALPILLQDLARKAALAAKPQTESKKKSKKVIAEPVVRDLLGIAPTGSGKTAAYVLPTLARLGAPKTDIGVRALLLAPTKELVEQMHREVERMCEGRKFKICNLTRGTVQKIVNSGNGRKHFSQFDLLIATPLRLVSLLRQQAIDLSAVEVIVLDEADRLLELATGRNSTNEDDSDVEGSAQNEEEDDNEVVEEEAEEANSDAEDDNEVTKGKRIVTKREKRVRSSFLSQVDEILSACPESTEHKLQRMLFSATVSPFVRELAHSFLQNPVEVIVGKINAASSTIEQKLTFVGREEGKILAIRNLISSGIDPPVIIFVQSVDRAKALFRELAFDKINVDMMHAQRSAKQREEVMRRFRLGDIWVLITTDILARGVDLSHVKMVINYDLPTSAVDYIHRIGRTGRAGRKGKAITFFTERDLQILRPIANVVRLSGGEVADWMLNIKQLSTREKKQLRFGGVQRKRIDHEDVTMSKGYAADSNTVAPRVSDKSKNKKKSGSKK